MFLCDITDTILVTSSGCICYWRCSHRIRIADMPLLQRLGWWKWLHQHDFWKRV